MSRVLDAAVHMRTASLAGVPLDRCRRIDDMQLVAVFEHRHTVARHNGHDREGRAVGLPAFGAAAGVVVGDVALDADLDRLVLAFADQSAAGKAARAFLDAAVDRWVDLNSHGLSSLCLTFLNQNTTTERIDLPSCMRSKPLLISSSLRTWVIMGSISIFP